MRLESVTLNGFKSFGERTEIKVLPGITAIVGPNGCGKCLAGDTLILLADGRRATIRDLVERGIQEAELIQHFDDGCAAVPSNSGVEVLSLNPVTLRLEPRPVEAFIRRTAPPFLLRVRTRSGREVVTTHYHPFFTLEAGALKVLKAEELAAGVKVAVPRHLPVKTAVDRSLLEDVAAAFTTTDRIWVPYSPELEGWLGTAARWAGGWEHLANAAGVEVAELHRVIAKRPVKVGALRSIVHAAMPLTPPIDALMSSRHKAIKVPHEMDGRLARFLGYLIAEGRNTAVNQVWFVNNDPAVNDDFARLTSELFCVIPRQLRYKAKATDTLIFSRALCLFLDRVFHLRVGGGSATKEVPPQLWTASDEVVAEFLGGLFEGDGYVHAARAATGRAMPYLEYVTASRRLADGVSTLLLRLGVFPLVRPKVKHATNTRRRRRRVYYSVYVYGAAQLRRLAGRIRFVGAKQTRLDDALRLEVSANPNLDLVPGCRPLVRAAVEVGRLNVKALRPLSPRLAAYVEGRCEFSRAGLREVAGLVERHGRRAAEAAPLIRRLRVLADSDAYWDEVVAIERTPPPEPWVYDLTVADTHNFVAANVIVHNSNISDAVRWALGEQSAKSLRGQRMEDLIFHGSASRRAVGLGEVELRFSNDGTLNVPWSEVAVARRLYRTGESEYLLNKSVTRLRDILDLFAGTGANPRAYSVMDQDKLNHVLTAKPHERRVFIEEAAGIARYKQQRNETEGKLEGARQNLQRVRDVMEEVRRQLASLERQAKKAQQYKALEQERQALRLTLTAADYAVLAAEGERLDAELATRRDREQTLRVRLTHLAAREATQREALLASDHCLADLRQSLQKVQAELERLLERREQMGVQLHETTEESSRLAEEIRAGTERLGAIVGERETTRAALAEAERLGAERQRAADDLAAQVERHRVELGGERGRLEAMRLEQVRLAAERADLTRSAGELRERQSQLGRRAERLAAELQEVEAEALRLAGNRSELETARDRA
ncbi:MAG: LAGLIDADG family homing endonuclease, partial [Candidatus Rokuibacteriota bacterium]